MNFTLMIKKFNVYQIWFIFSFLSLLLIGIFLTRHSLWGDEKHITETIRLFTNNLSLETIKDYPEVTPPVFFIVYALWAKLTGFSIESLRIFSLIIALVTWQFIFYLTNLFTVKKSHSILLSLLIVLNPYFIGTSVFVFTDMLTILFVVLSVIMFIKNRFFFYVLFSSLAILCRQYSVIIPLSIIIYSILISIKEKNFYVRFFIGSFISFIPLLILFIIWGNIAPVIGIKKWVVQNDQLFNLSSINTYITFSIIYTLPLIIIFFYKWKDYRVTDLVISFVFTLILLFFPIKPSEAALQQTDVRTLGLAHKYFVFLLGSESLFLKLIFGTFLLIGCYLTTVLIRQLSIRIFGTGLNRNMIFPIIWIVFLLVMPFSYQVWEKYLTMVLPFFMISIYQLIYPNEILIK